MKGQHLHTWILFNMETPSSSLTVASSGVMSSDCDAFTKFCTSDQMDLLAANTCRSCCFSPADCQAPQLLMQITTSLGSGITYECEGGCNSGGASAPLGTQRALIRCLARTQRHKVLQCTHGGLDKLALHNCDSCRNIYNFGVKICWRSVGQVWERFAMRPTGLQPSQLQPQRSYQRTQQSCYLVVNRQKALWSVTTDCPVVNARVRNMPVHLLCPVSSMY